MEPTIIFITLAGLVGLSLLIYGWKRDLARANDWAKLLQVLFTLGAFTLAAHWYFAERTGMPHAEVRQTIEAHGLGNDTVSVEAHVEIKNIGERLLRIEEIQSHLQDIDAATYDYVALARLEDARYWRARRPGSNENQFNGAELRWPVVRAFSERLPHDIEPGETDLLVITFLFRCSEVHSHVRVATDIINPATGPRRLAWKARGFLDLRNVCNQQQGAAR